MATKSYSKAEELEAIRALATKLGSDSYLGPWLQAVSYEVESSIRSDIFPSILPSDSARQAQAIIDQAEVVMKNAESKAASIIAGAEQRAANIIHKTEERNAAIIANAVDQTRKALHALQEV